MAVVQSPQGPITTAASSQTSGGSYDPSAYNPTTGAPFSASKVLNAVGSMFKFGGPQKKSPQVNNSAIPEAQFQAMWGTNKPGDLAPAHADPIGANGTLGSNYAWQSSDDYKRQNLNFPTPPSAAQFPQAAYNSFDQLHNWPDNTAQLTKNAGMPVMIWNVTEQTNP